MATLQPFLSRISTHDGRVLAAEALMNHVYGHHKHSQWQPRPLAENRSRYLWTDAFGICNYISLACEKDRIDYLVAADKLIASVLNTLGRHRGSSVRLGKATQRHPTLGGLRIGKMHPEGHPDGDGQYYHYLTKMAFALNRMSIITKQHHYNDWAIELLSSVHPHFVTPNKKMFWKLTVDMKHPLVLSEGNLDPYDGFITTQLLQAASTNPTTTLVSESSDFQSMVKCKYKSYSSSDPLDLGEALWLCHWALVTPSSTLARLSGNDCMEIWGHEISVRSLAALDSLWKDGYFDQPPGYRLAFRELGASLGLQVNPIAYNNAVWAQRAQRIHTYWSTRICDRDHDISPIMMASSLVPGCWNAAYEQRLVDFDASNFVSLFYEDSSQEGA